MKYISYAAIFVMGFACLASVVTADQMRPCQRPTDKIAADLAIP